MKNTVRILAGTTAASPRLTMMDLDIDAEVNPLAAQCLHYAQESARAQERARAADREARARVVAQFHREQMELRSHQIFLPQLPPHKEKQMREMLFGHLKRFKRDDDILLPADGSVYLPAYEEVEALLLGGPPWHGGHAQPLYRLPTSAPVPVLPPSNPLSKNAWREVQDRITHATCVFDIMQLLRKMWYTLVPAADPDNIDPRLYKGGCEIVEPRRNFARYSVETGKFPMIVLQSFVALQHVAPGDLCRTQRRHGINDTILWTTPYRLDSVDVARIPQLRQDQEYCVVETIVIRGASTTPTRRDPNVARVQTWLRHFCHAALAPFGEGTAPETVPPFAHWARGMLLAYAPGNILYYVHKYRPTTAKKPLGVSRVVEGTTDDARLFLEMHKPQPKEKKKRKKKEKK